MMRAFFNALLVGFGAATAQAADVDSRIKQAADAKPKYALGFGYAENSDQPKFKTFGPIQKGSDVPVAADAPWHIGSITKSFTASLIMRLVERDVLALDTPIGTYLPDDKPQMHADWQALTLRQLLSHTSGLVPNPPSSKFAIRTVENLHAVRRDILGDLWKNPIRGKAGTYRYSNLGYLLAGFIVEEMTDKTWEDLIRSELAEPLGMSSLGFGAPTQDGAPWGHRRFAIANLPVSPTSEAPDNPPWLGPAGTIHLSLADLVRWGEIHLAACQGKAPEFLEAKSCLEMRKIVAENYGLGWVIEREHEAPIVWHNGSNSMWYAMLMLVPEHNLVLVGTTNVYNSKLIDKLVADVRKMKTQSP